MATGRKNNRSLQVSVRLPLDNLEEIEKIKDEGESTAGFLIAAAKGEIKRRQRRKAKLETSED